MFNSFRIKVWTFVVAMAFCLGAATSSYAADKFVGNDINIEIAKKYVLYAMMSANSYHKPAGSDRYEFPIDILGWRLVDKAGKPTTQASFSRKFLGLAYDIYAHDDGKNVIVAFRGTENPIDHIWGNLFGAQYDKADEEFAKIKSAFPGRAIMVTGHSLGGGLALHISINKNFPGTKAVVFDTSPRIFDGLGDHHEPAERVSIYQEGEILMRARRIIKKATNVVPDLASVRRTPS